MSLSNLFKQFSEANEDVNNIHIIINEKKEDVTTATAKVVRKRRAREKIKISRQELETEKEKKMLHLKTTIFYFNIITKKAAKKYGAVTAINLKRKSSYVAICQNGLVEIIPDDQGNRSTSSYISFTSKGERLVLDADKNKLTSDPGNILFDVTRLIGREFNDPGIQQDIKHFQFKVIEKNSKTIIQIDTGKEEKTFTPEEILAIFFEKKREIAEAYLGKKITHTVVTVPAYFNDAQRQAVKDAGTISGLNVLRIINEPVAAAIAYGLNKQENEQKDKKTVLVFDLGGDIFTLSIVIVSDGIFKVVTTNSDIHLGGEDFNQRVMNYFIELFAKKTREDVRKDDRAFQKLRCEVEKAKRTLSSQHQTNIKIKSLINNKDFNETLTRDKFEDLNMELFQSTINTLRKVLKDVNFWKYDIDEIVLVGGSTHIPKIQQLIKEFFGDKEILSSINRNEVIAYGAALHAYYLSSKKIKDGDTIILFDTNPSTIGIKTVSGVMKDIFPRNTITPTKKSYNFTTVADNQPSVTIQIFKGERAMAKDNHVLGIFDLTGIPLAQQGVPQIEVTFKIDVNGIFIMTAKDKNIEDKTKNNIIIKSNNNQLLPTEIDFMIKDSESIAEKDKKVKELIDAEKKLGFFDYSMKILINETAKKELVSYIDLLTTQLKMIGTAIDEQTKWLEVNQDAEVDRLKEHKKQLEEVVKPIANKLSEQNSNSGGVGNVPRT